MPTAERCASPSQVGCTLNCPFCHTGTMRLVRNLTPGEIVGQVMLARDALGEWPKGKMDFAEVEDEGRIHRRRPPADQHRDDGHGRAAVQFRQCARRAEAGDGRRRARPVEAPHHAFDQRRGADDGALRRGDRRQPCGLAARRDQGSARRDRAASTASTGSRNCCRPAPTIPAHPTPGASPSNM